MNIDADDFTLLGLHKGFALERSQLDAAWKALQARVHPDRFAAEGGRFIVPLPHVEVLP